MRDKDGFICLSPRDSNGLHAPYNYPKVKLSKNALGANPILEGIEEPKKSSKYGPHTNWYQFSANAGNYHIDYRPKTWQYKAWAILSKGLDLTQKSAFRNVKFGNKKTRHILRIGVTLKVRSADHGKNRPILDQFTKSDSGYGMYTVADTPRDFVQMMNAWHHMVFDNILVYMQMARKGNIDVFTFIAKVFIIYDDLTFDCFMGDPRTVIDELHLEFDKKGRLVL